MKAIWKWKCRSRILLFCLLICCIAFLNILVMNMDNIFDSKPDLDYLRKQSVLLKKQIIDKSRKYVQTLVVRQKAIENDHAYSDINSGYDLKKTLAVLIEAMLQRLDVLEEKLNMLTNQNQSRQAAVKIVEQKERNSVIIGVKELYQAKQEECQLVDNWSNHYPNCQIKMDWMKSFWKSDPCYESLGVDGSQCSILIYLSEVESHCPKLAFRSKKVTTLPSNNFIPADYRPKSLDSLFKSMRDNPINYQWIKSRIERLWPRWKESYSSLVSKHNWTFSHHKRRKILLHLGFLTKESGFKFGEKSMKGGPLGELVQWSDVIAALHALGHEIYISTEIRTFISFAQADPALKSSCPVFGRKHHVDIIFTDIVGLKQMKKKIPTSLQNYKCRLRVLDSFGTQAEFNTAKYFLKHRRSIGGSKRNVWGGHNLNLQQFYTMYPHSSDNTFLGFIVDTYNSGGLNNNVTRNKTALVYGKEAYMWQGAEKEAFLKSIHDQGVQIHATVNTDGFSIPSFVHNHGLLSGPDLHRLLRNVKLFIGLGFPYEGPAPLEAIANGAIFLNPRFNPPKSRANEKFFAEKPTLRALTSQNPYTEDFIGAPHVLTVDITNTESVKKAVDSALLSRNMPYLPYEFTVEGMLERVHTFLEHQDFCQAERNWPPFAAHRIVFKVDSPGVSCAQSCWEQQMICEPSYFAKINVLESFEQHAPASVGNQNAKLPNATTPSPSSFCAIEDRIEHVSAPYFLVKESKCVLQSMTSLFSCAAPALPDTVRLCPCRDFIKDQTALCAACL